MTEQEIIEKVRAEVNRLKKQLVRGACAAQIQMETSCKDEAYDEMLSILSDLEKECEEKPTNIDFEQELYKHFGQVKDFTLGMQIGKYFYELGKQEKPTPAEGLEEEIERYLHSLGVGYGGWVDGMEDDDLRGIARHFAKWGAEHYPKLAFLSKFAEMTGSIDKMPKNILPPSKECEKGLREPLVSDDLEEAAKKFVGYDMDTDDLRDYEIGVSSFKAGAKWQEEQDLKYVSEIHQNGYNLCKERMMKGAVETEVIKDYDLEKGTILSIKVEDVDKDEFYEAQNVKLIIVKED